MALLEILKYPDPRLRAKAKPITQFDDALRRIVDDMYETMYANQGVGLAGTQVNMHQQIFTLDISESHNEPICMINAEIISQEGSSFAAEGCLSVGGGAFDKVKRASRLRVRALDLDGKSFELDAEGLLAICIQHVIDHLNGILFIDHLSRLKQDRIRKKITKEQQAD